MAYDNRYRDRGRFDDERERWRSEERDYRGGRDRDYGRGSAWESGGYGRDDERDEGRDHGQDFGGDYGRGQRGEPRGIFGRGEGSSRGYGVYGGSYGGGDQGRSDYGRGDYGRGEHGRGGDHGRGESWGRGGSWRGSDYGRSSGGMFGDYGGRSQGGESWRGSDMGRGSAGAGYGYGEGRGYTGAYGPREDDRGFFERAGDEIASWFGDDDAARRRERDARAGDQGAQHHRGRGPRGYSRSDDRIREDVNDRLTDDPYIDASDIEVRVEKGEVTLTGQVDSRTVKRRAEDIAESVSGVTHVQNNLRVRQGTGMGSSTTTGAAAMAGLGGSTAGTSTSGSTGSGSMTGGSLSGGSTSGSGTAGTNTTGTIPMTSRSTNAGT